MPEFVTAQYRVVLDGGKDRPDTPLGHPVFYTREAADILCERYNRAYPGVRYKVIEEPLPVDATPPAGTASPTTPAPAPKS